MQQYPAALRMQEEYLEVAYALTTSDMAVFKRLFVCLWEK
jgi:hypothetical protein